MTFDPRTVSYPELLEVFWSSHDPTTRNRQGADVGTQYRSAVFTHSDRQRRLAEAYKLKLDAAGVFASPVVTEITPAGPFYPAEGYHQDYFALNPRRVLPGRHPAEARQAPRGVRRPAGRPVRPGSGGARNPPRRPKSVDGGVARREDQDVRLGADVGVAATGVAGPAEQEGHPPGTVFLGLAYADHVEALRVRLPGDRRRIREYAVISVLNLLRLRISGSSRSPELR